MIMYTVIMMCRLMTNVHLPWLFPASLWCTQLHHPGAPCLADANMEVLKSWREPLDEFVWPGVRGALALRGPNKDKHPWVEDPWVNLRWTWGRSMNLHARVGAQFEVQSHLLTMIFQLQLQRSRRQFVINERFLSVTGSYNWEFTLQPRISSDYSS